jgi:hypothetical protein
MALDWLNCNKLVKVLIENKNGKFVQKEVSVSNKVKIKECRQSTKR